MTCQYSTWPNLSALLTFQKKYSGAWALITVFQILNKIIFGSWNQKTFSNRREGFYLLNRDLELFNTLWCKIQCWILIWKCKTCEEICAFLLLTLLCTLSSFFFLTHVSSYCQLQLSVPFIWLFFFLLISATVLCFLSFLNFLLIVALNLISENSSYWFLLSWVAISPSCHF